MTCPTTARPVLRRWLFTLTSMATLLAPAQTFDLVQRGIDQLIRHPLLSLVLCVVLIALLQAWLLVSPCRERLGDWLAHRLPPYDRQEPTR